MKRGSRFIKILLVSMIGFIILSFSYLFYQSTQEKVPRPVKGICDLSDWNINSEMPSLVGEWEFYWEELYNYRDFQKGNTAEAEYVSVPKTWNSYQVRGDKLPGFGYATYRVKVIVDDISMPLSLRLDTMSTAYRLFVNEKEIASSGSVGMDKITSLPGYRPMVVEFTPPAKEFYLIIQVSNFTYARGGIWYNINMGTRDQMEGMNRLIIYKDGILIGSLLIMALYYASFYFILQRDKSSLYFMLLCLVFLLRTSLYGDMFLVRLFPDIPFGVMIFLTYVTLYWIPAIIFLMVDSIYPCRLPFLFGKVFVIYSILATLLTAILPIHIYTCFITVIEVIGISIVAFSVGIVTNAYHRHEKKAGIILFVVAFILIAGIHDVLYQANVISHSLGEMAPFGIFLLLFVFSFIVASRLSDSYKIEKCLSQRLNESLVNEKKAAKELMKTELSFLQAQIKPHFLYNSLSVIAALCTQEPQRAKELLYDLSDYLRGSFAFENYDGVTPLSSELSTVRAYLSIEQARFGEKMWIEYDVDESIDILIPILGIQPLVENAIRHGIMKKIEGGKVRLSVKKINDATVIIVEDDGVGMTADKISEIFMTEEGKRGVGLTNIRSRLKAYYGQELLIESAPGKGTKVTMIIPEEREIDE